MAKASADEVEDEMMSKIFDLIVVVVLPQPPLWLFSRDLPNLPILVRTNCRRLVFLLSREEWPYCPSGRTVGHHHSLAEQSLKKRRNEIHIV
jgi:hypothetical protein